MKRNPFRPATAVLGSVGSPTTVVYATELSTPAILDGIRAGHVFLDVAGKHDRLLEVTARAGNLTAHAGDAISAAQGEAIQFEAHITAAAGGKMRWMEYDQDVAPTAANAIFSADATQTLSWTSDGRRHWFRAEVTGSDGKLWLIGNPVYLNWDVSNGCDKAPSSPPST